MIIDARELERNKILEADVCIVGAGTAGLTLAKEFIDNNFSVCLVESGGFETDKATQGLYEGENIGLPYFPLDTARARYFGGSCNRWHVDIKTDDLGARMRPFDKIDFEKREEIPNSGWPFSKEHLDPYYDRAQITCKITPATYKVDDWLESDEIKDIFPDNDSIETVIFKIGSKDPFVDEIKKNILEASNITTLLNANVTEIETNEDGSVVERLRITCIDKKDIFVKARYYILAAGGIEIPRILLSSDKKLSCGLGNQHDLVGRYFMEHLHFWSGYFIPNDQNFFEKTCLYNEIRTVNDVPIIGKLSIKEDVLRKQGLPNYSGQLIPRIMLNSSVLNMLTPVVRSGAMNTFKNIIKSRNIYNLTKNIKQLVNQRQDIINVINRKIKTALVSHTDKSKRNIYRIANMTEQIPNPQSRVVLSSEKDILGRYKANLDWRVTSLDILGVKRIHEIIDIECKKMGYGSIYIELKDDKPPINLHGGYHHMGTTRMHDNEKEGVVDKDSKLFGTSNLFIAGPSVFTTGGYVNPSLTVVALSIRLADHIKKIIAK